MTTDVGSAADPKDLAAAVFAILADEFFDSSGKPTPFSLRDKRQTQDDPFDEHIGAVLDRDLPEGMKVLLSGKPLVSPDMVVARPEETRKLLRGGVDLDPRRIIAIEVKKVNLDASGRAARGSGLDYNSTPPCATVKVTARSGETLLIPGFYLFVVLEEGPNGLQQVHTLALVSGAVLNEDTAIYDAATGIRQKVIGIGSYGDGLDRQRPMFVFANPLGWDWLSGKATLIHPHEGLAEEQDDLVLVRDMSRQRSDGHELVFSCYRPTSQGSAGEPLAVDPFPTPANRKSETTARGRFIVDL